MVLPPIVVGILWRVMYTVDISPLHRFMAWIGLPVPPLITDPDLALWAIVIADTWEWFPFTMLMVLAALQMIPDAPVEAAKIDGANDLQMFRYVLLPYIAPTLVVAGLFRLIDSIKAFPLIYVLTDGGPGDATEVTNYYAFLQAFNFSLWGYASAIATLMVAAIFLLSWIIDRLRGDRAMHGRIDALAPPRAARAAGSRAHRTPHRRCRRRVLLLLAGAVPLPLAGADVVPAERRHLRLHAWLFSADARALPRAVDRRLPAAPSSTASSSARPRPALALLLGVPAAYALSRGGFRRGAAASRSGSWRRAWRRRSPSPSPSSWPTAISGCSTRRSA